MDLIVDPLSFIGRAISPGVLSSSLFLTHDVLALVSGTLRPSLYTLAVLLVLLPFSFVASSLHVGVDSMTISLVVHPATFVDIAVGMEEFSLAARLVELPLAFVASTVNPFHLALAMTKATFPEACIFGSCLVGVLTFLEAGIVLVRPSQGFATFITLEVFTLHLAGELHYAISTPL